MDWGEVRNQAAEPFIKPHRTAKVSFVSPNSEILRQPRFLCAIWLVATVDIDLDSGMADSSDWYLMKSQDKHVFGPTTLAALQSWAAEAKISPMDKVSHDARRSWVRAPMVAQLQMDWLIELEDEYLYGPTTIGTIQEFLATGEIDEHTQLINCRDNYKGSVRDLNFLVSSPRKLVASGERPLGRRSSDLRSNDLPAAQRRGGQVQQSLQEKVRALETQVLNLRLEVGTWQDRYERLRREHEELTG
jgi:hypothetical protein